VDLSSNPIHADGHTNITSPSLPLKFNLDPITIIELITIRASQKGVDLGPLTGLFQIVLSNPNFRPPVRMFPRCIYCVMLTYSFQIVPTVDPNAPTCVRFVIIRHMLP
jgi:hypothetical protein